MSEKGFLQFKSVKHLVLNLIHIHLFIYLFFCRFSDHLRRFSNVFDFTVDNGVTLHSSLRTAEDRTKALGEVIKSLGEKLIPGIRNEVILELMLLDL